MDDVDAPVELILLVLGEAMHEEVPDPCRIFVDSC
jgi:hypothetical protein